MTLTDIIATLTNAVILLGYVRFGVLFVVNVILWRIHSLLGLVGTLLTLGYLLHFF